MSVTHAGKGSNIDNLWAIAAGSGTIGGAGCNCARCRPRRRPAKPTPIDVGKMSDAFASPIRLCRRTFYAAPYVDLTHGTSHDAGGCAITALLVYARIPIELIGTMMIRGQRSFHDFALAILEAEYELPSRLFGSIIHAFDHSEGNEWRGIAAVMKLCRDDNAEELAKWEAAIARLDAAEREDEHEQRRVDRGVRTMPIARVRNALRGSFLELAAKVLGTIDTPLPDEIVRQGIDAVYDEILGKLGPQPPKLITGLAPPDSRILVPTSQLDAAFKGVYKPALPSILAGNWIEPKDLATSLAGVGLLDEGDLVFAGIDWNTAPIAGLTDLATDDTVHFPPKWDAAIVSAGCKATLAKWTPPPPPEYSWLDDPAPVAGETYPAQHQHKPTWFGVDEGALDKLLLAK